MFSSRRKTKTFFVCVWREKDKKHSLKFTVWNKKNLLLCCFRVQSLVFWVSWCNQFVLQSVKTVATFFFLKQVATEEATIYVIPTQHYLPHWKFHPRIRHHLEEPEGKEEQGFRLNFKNKAKERRKLKIISHEASTKMNFKFQQLLGFYFQKVNEQLK